MALRLDDEQRAAAMAPERFVRVRAGAGTGKTTCLVARIRHLVMERDVDPRAICAVTFSKRAAEEIARRVGNSGIGSFIGTIHSLGYRMLQYERRSRPIADERKRSAFVLRAIKETGCRDPLNVVKARIARARAFGKEYPPDVVAVGKCYERILHEDEKLWDFDDLIYQPTVMFATEIPVREKWLRRFGHVIVDEAQDTSTVQWDLLQYLVGVSTGLYVVGDPGQSIYTWRGATRDGMLVALERRFDAEFATYTLSRNYRSRGLVIDVANRVLRGKKEHVQVVQARDETPTEYPVVVGGTWQPSMIASIEQALTRVMDAKIPVHDAVVLGRTHAVLGECESVCIKLGIPYVVSGGFSFYERTEIKDVMAYLEIAAGVNTIDALERIYNRPSRYLGKVWRDTLQAQGGWPAWLAGERFTWPQRYMAERAAELERVVKTLQVTGPHSKAELAINYVLSSEGVGYQRWVTQDGLTESEASEDNDVIENLRALQEGAKVRGQSIADFVGFVDQCRHRPRRMESAAGALTLSTIHKAKGLEWPVVVLIGLEEGILPHKRGEPEGEERRLYYVAVSRARDALILVASGEPEAQPEFDGGYVSRYVRETIETIGLTGMVPEPELLDGEVIDGVVIESVTERLALPAPERDADCGEAELPLGDGIRGADGSAEGGAGPTIGNAGAGESDDGLGSPGGAADGDLPGDK